MESSKGLIKGFSKLTKKEKLSWVADLFHSEPEEMKQLLSSFDHGNKDLQKILDAFSENTIANFTMPYSLAPNFVINEKVYAIPMVIEESSVVAAASASAKYWMSRGGFNATVLSTSKVGQIHMTCSQDETVLRQFFDKNKNIIQESCKNLLTNMEQRGGGITDISLVTYKEEPDYYQIRMNFETCDSMGANFINSVLEAFAKALRESHQSTYGEGSNLEVIMCILSNYTPKCLVKSEVSCSIRELGHVAGLSPSEFAQKFNKAVRIAEIDPYRATTHNKGIYNGIDAVVLATGNDFRAIEACGHAYACRDGQYKSLTHCEIKDDMFRFWIEVPMALGTVGGLTKLHPLAKVTLDILGQPSAQDLMKITATVGLAQNFGALKSLISTGIQKGHMKMHLSNVLHQMKATEQEFKLAIEHFRDKIVSHRAVEEFLNSFKTIKQPSEESSKGA